MSREVDPRKCSSESFVGLFLHGYNTELGRQARIRRLTEKRTREGSLARFMAIQRLDIYAVEAGIQAAGMSLTEDGALRLEQSP